MQLLPEAALRKIYGKGIGGMAKQTRAPGVQAVGACGQVDSWDIGGLFAFRKFLGCHPGAWSVCLS